MGIHRYFHLQVRNLREDWDLQVTQPVAGNYYPVSKSSHFQIESIYRFSIERSNMFSMGNIFDMGRSICEKVNNVLVIVWHCS
jgi:hypothetical protein